MPTVASVAWQTDQILRRILPESVGDEWRDGSGHIALTQLPYAEAWVGHRVTRLERDNGMENAMRYIDAYGLAAGL